ncbi:MAG TPA: hypothetical protein VN457_05480, partial [Chlamydiales bacterium]|nr:hypothetical protein [Chlamydiales bacterium]
MSVGSATDGATTAVPPSKNVLTRLVDHATPHLLSNVFSYLTVYQTGPYAAFPGEETRELRATACASKGLGRYVRKLKDPQNTDFQLCRAIVASSGVLVQLTPAFADLAKIYLARFQRVALDMDHFDLLK